MPDWIAEQEGAIILSVHAQPGAKRTEVAGVHGDALRIRLAAPPVDGQANEALITFLAGAFGVPKRQVDLLSGHASRSKRVRVNGATKRPDRQW
ncbi:MAG: DUF167 domain-containing protein [Flavobacteriales bacterium]|jgi:uncharacterized protein (TIGR00251 family)|nr:MAG: DUF167 domain-containing protein [Flavobacteriales bacterium]